MRAFAALVMVFLPRSAIAYPAYCVAPLFMIRWREALAAQTLVFMFITFALCIEVLASSVSLSVALLEYALCFAFLLGVFGSDMHISRITPVGFVRASSVIITVTSLFSLVQQGFPLRLPYVDFLPDYYYATFGLGGAKAVTILSYVAIIAEIVNKKITGKWHRGFLLLAVANFLMPSFVIGILCGALSCIVLTFRRPILLIVISALLIFVIGPYLMFRFESVSGGFPLVYGSHPKIYQFVMVLQFFSDNPHLIFTGSGIGQYAGQATLWASPIGQILSSFNIPTLPGMFAPETHLQYAEPVLGTFIENTWAIKSTSNKPYSSISVLMVEFGLPMTALMIGYMAKRYLSQTKNLEFAAFFLFSLSLMFLDRVHDMPWFGVSLIIANSLIVAIQAHTKSPTISA